MFIQVQLLQYAAKIFTYFVPNHLEDQISCGTLIRVPLKKKIVPAVVCMIHESEQLFAFKVKSIIDIYRFPTDATYSSFLQKVGHLYQTDPIVFLQRLQHILEQQESVETLFVEQPLITEQHVTLTQEQQNAVDEIMPNISTQKHDVFVLHGVTGSGKTEVYKILIEKALAQQQSIIVMFPEVSLALQFEKIFKFYFQSTLVFGFHCVTTKKQKNELWNCLLSKQPVIIIGVHLPVMLPIANLGLIIVDEEHDHGYQEKKHPKLHSRDMAILKAYLFNIPIVLGSATPSVSTFFNVQNRGWKLLSMTKRFAGSFPKINVVSMAEQKKRKHFWFTSVLLDAIQNRLNQGEQIIIFLNRRGFSFFVQCICGFVFMCKQCSVSLTLHEGFALLCHYCGQQEVVPITCPCCHEQAHNFLKKGIGTQQVVALLEKIFPNARIARADMDSTRHKRTWAQTVVMMQNKEIDILVGTQTITKGYHFPGVTLVGVLWADLNLHFPVYNAAEICLQQLIQVAGRAGRQSDDSLVIVQAFDTHPIFQFLNEIDYQKFYAYEIEKRIEVGYPPYKHIAEIEIKAQDEQQLKDQAKLFYNKLKIQADVQNNVEIFGPVQSIVHRIKNIHSQKIYLKSHSRAAMIELFAQMQKHSNFSVSFTIDPV